MPLTIKEVKYFNGIEETSYEPKLWEAHLTMKRPPLDTITHVVKATKPTITDTLNSLVAKDDELLASTIALSGGMTDISWSLLYQYAQPIKETTYLRGQVTRLTLEGTNYIGVFNHPVTVSFTMDYSRLVTDGHLILIKQPTRKET